jgi:hypothetical protein
LELTETRYRQFAQQERNPAAKNKKYGQGKKTRSGFETAATAKQGDSSRWTRQWPADTRNRPGNPLDIEFAYQSIGGREYTSKRT